MNRQTQGGNSTASLAKSYLHESSKHTMFRVGRDNTGPAQLQVPLYESWARPTILKLHLVQEDLQINNHVRKQNLLQQRRMLYSLKYKRLKTEKARVTHNSTALFNKVQNPTNHDLESNVQSRKHIRTSVIDKVSDINQLKKTLISTCQTKPVQLQKRPQSSRKMCRSEPNDNTKSNKDIQLIRPKKPSQQPKLRPVNRSTTRIKRESFDFVAGW